ncbi:hypothetical protein WJX81_008400 [Elliptochloris bilobata]|uniref:Cytidyltransferase-like domain-containing protein n=1 Tax=Elliptochloris bilobata TaxID=381761 RepID=A0AAW1S0L7_9CHLO
MSDAEASLVQSIHATTTKAVFYAAGGGAQALSWLLAVPGASHTVLDARVPYAPAAMAELLGGAPATYASGATASAMARAAYQQAAQLAALGEPVVGLACTCALATDRPKQGEHKVCVATHDGLSTRYWSLRLAKGARDRAGEDVVASRMALHALAGACGGTLYPGAPGVPLDAALGLLPAARGAAEPESVQESMEEVGDPLQALLAGRACMVEFSGGHVFVDAPRGGRLYLPGSFNPLHDGHRGLLAAGSAACGGAREALYELSVGNPDKGMLALDDVRQRVAQFTETGLPLVVTQASLFTDKAKLFPGSAFVIGYDTAVRLVAPRYYARPDGAPGEETAEMLLQLAAAGGRGCRFLVAGRVDEKKAFMTLADVAVPPQLQRMGLFQDIPESAFRLDLSSTELRQESKR